MRPIASRSVAVRPLGAFEDDHRRHLFGRHRAGAVALQRRDRPRRFGVVGQEARLAGGGDVADPSVGEEAGGADRQPDGDRQPAPAPAR